MLIYMITNNITGQAYIGQTKKTLEERKRNHFNALANNRDTYLYNAMRKYGKENFSWKVIEDNIKDVETLSEREIFYIDKYKTYYTYGGYNLTHGGERPPEYNEVVSRKHLDKMQSADVRSRISETMQKYVAENGFSDEHRKNISIGLKRFYSSGRKPNYKQPQHLSEKHKEALILSRYKRICCYNEFGFYNEFNSLQEASKWLNEFIGKENIYKSNASKMSVAAKNGTKFHGLFWGYIPCVETIEKDADNTALT